MTPKNRTLEGKNRTLGGEGGGQKSSKIVGHHLCTFPFCKFLHQGSMSTRLTSQSSWVQCAQYLQLIHQTKETEFKECKASSLSLVGFFGNPW